MRVDHNYKNDVRKIEKYRAKLIFMIKKNKSIDSINEWLVDNYFILLENRKCIIDELSFNELEKIKRKRKNFLIHLVEEILEKTGYAFNSKKIYSDIYKFQEKNNDYFSYSELSYIFVMFKIVLIKQLRDLSMRLNERLEIKMKMVNKYNKIIKNSNRRNFKLSNYLKIDEELLNNDYYVEQLNHLLRRLGSVSEDEFIKLNKIFDEKNLSMKDMIDNAHKKYTEDSILMSNIFNFLKGIIRVEFHNFLTETSHVERVLCSEKVNIYENMYENNKVEYRRKVFKNAKRKKVTQYKYAMDLVKKSDEENRHIGFNLFKKKNIKLRTYIYIFFCLLFTISASYGFSLLLHGFTFFLLLIPMSIVSIEIINQVLMHFIRPNTLNKIKFEDNIIPLEYSTMVIIPTILNSEDKVNKMFDHLEAYYLSNKSKNLYFTLLGDCTSAKEKDIPLDEVIVKAGLKKVRELNQKYNERLFYFIYRNRFYNEGEGEFLGLERKRGAINHFNKLILGQLSEEETEKYFRCETFKRFNKKIKYVITLDCDTKIVLNTAIKMVGTMAHPMNQAVLSSDKKVVVSGYGIMQPRISIDVEVTNKSQYSQLFAGLGGLDIYTTAFFELYQDVFGEANFAGKGIYDLEVFNTVLDGRFPDNLILSHDLLEGTHIRAGLIDDLEVFDEYPSSYLKDSARHHRWNRGDWQIISWLFPKVRDAKNKKIKNEINALSKWKIFDNLRRSTVYFFLMLFLFFGITFGGECAVYYFIITLFIIFIPSFFYLISKLFYRSKKDPFLKYYLFLFKGFIATVDRAVVTFSVLPYEVFTYFDSSVKALYRMFVSHKKLLNWVTAEELESRMNDKFITYIKAFKINYISALLLVILSILFNKQALPIAILTSSLWILAPIIMHRMSKSIVDNKPELNGFEKENVKELALKTWKYFSDNLNESNNYLVPDNYQINRYENFDYKTSPTNIGFSLVSIVSAYELGFIDEKKAVFYISNIIDTVERLEKWNGHLFNWYNIYDLKKLPNYFVSTVDSGNYTSALFVVKAFLTKLKYPTLVKKIKGLIDEVDFSKLYNSDLDVFSIGYDYTEDKLIPYNYNNFASESRLASFVAIAKGDVPFKHWFCLDKTLTKYKRYKGVVSWNGTAFEYFMPLIFMDTFKHTILDESYHFALFAQKRFMKKIDKRLPWGISESGYNELDDSQSYKYKAFGVPFLKFKEEQNSPIVLSPYSSIMAIGLDETSVYQNLEKFIKLGLYSEYGFYESYDNDDKAVVKAYYAHHQGMILSSIANYLKKNVIRNYFHNNKEIDSVEMLLKEKVQLDVYINLKDTKYRRYDYNVENEDYDIREFNEINEVDEYSVLSNGFYSVLMDDKGRGISKYKNLQINRYRNITDQDYGMFLYIKNKKNNHFWSNTFAPTYKEPEKYKVIFSGDKVKYIRDDEGIATTTEVVVPRKDNAEVRKITIKNNNKKSVILELTSYFEMIMCRNEEDIAHRTFNALSITSEVENDSLIFKRKSRTKDNTNYFIINKMFIDKSSVKTYFENDRTRFIGRNNSILRPDALTKNYKFSESVIPSVDPISSIRKTVTLEPSKSIELYLICGFGKSKIQVLDIVNSYDSKEKIENMFNDTAVYNHMIDSYSNITLDQKRIYNKVLKYIYSKNFNKVNFYNDLSKIDNLDKKTLWKYGISGNLPIVLVEVYDSSDLYLIAELLKMFEFFKTKTIYIDVVILNNQTSEDMTIVKYINKFIYRINHLNYFENTLGNIYNIAKRDLSTLEEEKIKLFSLVSLTSKYLGSFEDQIDSSFDFVTYDDFRNFEYIKNIRNDFTKKLDFDNSFGGFTNDGKEYLIKNVSTPMPWINVLAGNHFGSIVSAGAGGFTYVNNSNMFKFSSWSNDITRDNISEKIIISGKVFVPSIVKHGFGYTEMFAETKDYKICITNFVGLNSKKKYFKIDIKNKTDYKKELDIDLLVKMVLGNNEEYTSKYIMGDFDKDRNIFVIQNKASDVYSEILTYMTSSLDIERYQSDLYYKTIGVSFELNKLESKKFSFTMGVLNDDEKSIDEEYREITNFWDDKLGSILVDTPDKSFNYMINGWSLYQVYSSRIMAKAAFYQTGGAIGFRDQLQDMMGIIYNDPNAVRNQIIEHAKHQFLDGSVLHWWHEDVMFGSRTTFSDDYLWLIYVTNEYIRITGDNSILKENACFVKGEELGGRSEMGLTYSYINEEKTIYEHMKLCVSRALNRFGQHNLPLMGCGDWNDGMSHVGRGGKGESVFVGFFLYDILQKMSDISTSLNDKEFAVTCNNKAVSLKNDLNNYAWDGDWYLRAFYDNGDSIGSRNNMECNIDLLSQTWSILSDVAPTDRKKKVLEEVSNKLVDNENKILKLLTPPFENSINYPGYIKDYIPGTRENGGQYTHASLWYILSLLKEHDTDKAYEYYSWINPINRTKTFEDVLKYKVEPYAIVADIYSNPDLVGRGGWSWYTGSASWFYKIGIEEILGFKKEGNKLKIVPNICSKWSKYSIKYKYESSVYEIFVINGVSSGKVEMVLDGKAISDEFITLKDDGLVHKLEVKIKG
ncbi:MAG: glucoamylase family protein [Bacilli bacterium]|nr:glucoamylase family protein [Bacilli bacterium]